MLRGRTRAGGGPEEVARLVPDKGLDVDHVESVAFVDEVVDGPFQGQFASPGEVDGHSDLPVLGHAGRSAYSIPIKEEQEKNSFKDLSLERTRRGRSGTRKREIRQKPK